MSRLICGVDEAGRGPLAGSVYAAAVVLNPASPIEGLMDSKKISEKKRDLLTVEIKKHALAWGIAHCTVEEIDQINILQASLLAMKRAIDKMQQAFPHIATEDMATQDLLIQVDGNKCPQIDLPCEAIVKGDSKVAAISAASILAKTARDAELYALDKQYPEYQFAKHKGYPTKLHMTLLEAHGISHVHRRSYGPVKKLIA